MPIEESSGAEASAGQTGSDPVQLDTEVLVADGPYAGRSGTLVDFTRRAARGVVVIDGVEVLIPVGYLR